MFVFNELIINPWFFHPLQDHKVCPFKIRKWVLELSTFRSHSFHLISVIDFIFLFSQQMWLFRVQMDVAQIHIVENVVEVGNLEYLCILAVTIKGTDEN